MDQPTADFFNFDWYDLDDNSKAVNHQSSDKQHIKTMIMVSTTLDNSLKLFLTKILKSVNLELNKNATLLDTDHSISKTELENYSKCIIFGPNQLFEETSLVTSKRINNTSILLAPPLSLIHSSTDLKRTLWDHLKKTYAL